VHAKPDAPAEIRGEFALIPTAVPDTQVSEILPHVAAPSNSPSADNASFELLRFASATTAWHANLTSVECSAI